jgi:hypothetical protein
MQPFEAGVKQIKLAIGLGLKPVSGVFKLLILMEMMLFSRCIMVGFSQRGTFF